ncbi:MAG TPA: pilus assembly protein TadG-related protein [Zeimonas sp.]
MRIRHAKRLQRGQALVLALVLLFAALLALFLLFSAGQVVTTKQRLVNAADAAAYSAALWRARVLNVHAYANRAIVAQEVAVAQAVTLVSWAKYFERFTGNASALAAAWPPAAPVLSAAASVARTARELTEAAAVEEIRVRAAPSVGYKSLLARSQEALQLAADSFGLGAVANEIVRANDPTFFAFALGDEGAFARFTRRYESDADRARLQDVTVESLDPFVRGARRDDLRLLLLPSSCFGRTTSFDRWFRWWRKRGGTEMPDLERWQAVDTGSIHNWRKSGFLVRSCRQREWLPVGWGAAQASDGTAAPGLVGNTGNTLDNRMATALAEAEIIGEDAADAGRYGGIERVRELNYGAFADDRFPVSQVVVLARAEARHVRTANALDVGIGRLRLFEAFAGNRLWAMAVGEAYFRRAPGAPERIEYASLYSPYWQARLAEPSEAQRAAALRYAR